MYNRFFGVNTDGAATSYEATAASFQFHLPTSFAESTKEGVQRMHSSHHMQPQCHDRGQQKSLHSLNCQANYGSLPHTVPTIGISYIQTAYYIHQAP